MAQGRAWLATILREFAGRRIASVQTKWFGGAGGQSTEQVRQRLLDTMNFMDREFNQGFHFVYPADSAQESACSRTGIVAYVWRFSSGASGYQESQGPKCRSGTSAFTSRCGIDENGKYFVYLCTLWMRQGEEGQTGILVHEA